MRRLVETPSPLRDIVTVTSYSIVFVLVILAWTYVPAWGSLARADLRVRRSSRSWLAVVCSMVLTRR